MKKKRLIFLSGFLFTAFILFTFAISFIDVKPIGPMESSVGFAKLNSFFHRLTGVSLPLYSLTDLLSIIPLSFSFVFALIGLLQWIKRKSIFKVDRNIIFLGFFYIITLLSFLFFEAVVINYRPILINGMLEASYPSSTTMLVTTIMPTTAIQVSLRIKNKTVRAFSIALIYLFSSFMVILRFISGVHWFTDIVGGLLLSSALVLMYRSIIK